MSVTDTLVTIQLVPEEALATIATSASTITVPAGKTYRLRIGSATHPRPLLVAITGSPYDNTPAREIALGGNIEVTAPADNAATISIKTLQGTASGYYGEIVSTYYPTAYEIGKLLENYTPGGGGSSGPLPLIFPIEASFNGFVSLPLIVTKAGTISKVTILSKTVGTVSAHLETASSYSTYPSGFTSISGASPITLSTAQKNQDATLTGWTKALTVGQVVQLVVDAVAGTDSFTVIVEVS